MPAVETVKSDAAVASRESAPYAVLPALDIMRSGNDIVLTLDGVPHIITFERFVQALGSMTRDAPAGRTIISFALDASPSWLSWASTVIEAQTSSVGPPPSK